DALLLLAGTILYSAENFASRIESTKDFVLPQQSPVTNLSLSIRCTNQVVKVGDEISIEFLVTNLGPDDFTYLDFGYPGQARKPPYRLVVKTATGELAPNPRGEYIGYDLKASWDT